MRKIDRKKEEPLREFDKVLLSVSSGVKEWRTRPLLDDKRE